MRGWQPRGLSISCVVFGRFLQPSGCQRRVVSLRRARQHSRFIHFVRHLDEVAHAGFTIVGDGLSIFPEDFAEFLRILGIASGPLIKDHHHSGFGNCHISIWFRCLLVIRKKANKTSHPTPITLLFVFIDLFRRGWTQRYFSLSNIFISSIIHNNSALEYSIPAGSETLDPILHNTFPSSSTIESFKRFMD